MKKISSFFYLYEENAGKLPSLSVQHKHQNSDRKTIQDIFIF